VADNYAAIDFPTLGPLYLRPLSKTILYGRGRPISISFMEHR